MSDDLSTGNSNLIDETMASDEQDVFVFPTSFAQERLWLLDQIGEKKAIYNSAGALHLLGDLKVSALERAFSEIVQRHEILRTNFTLLDGSLVQLVIPSLTVSLEVVDLQFIPEKEQLIKVQDLAREEIEQSFDLEKTPLWRLKLYKLGTKSHVLLVIMHHIICDGWSIGVLIQELSKLYDAFLKGLPSPLPELEIQYADFSEWQRQWMTEELLNDQLNYWQQELAGAPSMLTLPTDRPRPSIQTHRGAHHSIVLSKPLASSLQDMSRRHGVTLFVTILAGLKLLLAKWTGQNDLLLGTVIAGRNRTEIEPLIGCFMNFLALRSQVLAEQTVEEFLEQEGKIVFDTYAHQDCPFEKIVEILNPQRERSHNPIYNVALLLHNFPLNLAFGDHVEASHLKLDSQFSLLDLRFEVFASYDEILINCEYNTDLFNSDTIVSLLDAYGKTLKKLTDNPQAKLSEFKLTDDLAIQAKKAQKKDEKPTLAIAATFTAENIEDSLDFWLKELGLSFQIKFAPYNQVFQELLSPTSLLTKNKNGINVILLRFEDWEKSFSSSYYSKDDPHEYRPTSLKAKLHDLVEALKTSSELSSTPYFVCCCPSSSQTLNAPKQQSLYGEMEEWLATSLKDVAGAYLVKTSELTTFYPVENYYDRNSDELGHIPYTLSGFASLGTMLARKLHTLKRQQYKVIVLDCDQTLWKGVCGEDGVEGIEINPAYQALQKFMLAQRQQGKILCLCSKNEEEDVWTVFESHPSMLIKSEDIVAWRINWLPKSDNLQSISQELQLGLDSFILVDDNPVECAEVEANCPGVLTIQVPQDCEQIPQFLNHVWAFDSLKVTQEDRVRSKSYEQNRDRERFRRQSLTFEDFLANLNLNIQIKPAKSDDFVRISQLTQRTNQFNMTTRRRSEAEIRQLCETGQLECLVVRVMDRFGDYGLVGVMLFEMAKEAIFVDTFLLSCRALGRGVEYQMLANLGVMAQERGLRWVEVPCYPTAKNQPARNFIEKVGEKYRQELEDQQLHRFPVEEMIDLSFQPDKDIKPVKESSILSPSVSTEKIQSYFPSIPYQRIATELNKAEEILRMVESQRQWQQRNIKEEFVAPRSQIETEIADIWSELLKVEQIGVYDNFFALGGSSLIGVQLLNRLRQAFKVEFPLVCLFEKPTVAGMAEMVKGLVSTKKKSDNPYPVSDEREEIDI